MELPSGEETVGLTKRIKNLSRKKRLVFSFIVFLIPATTISAIYVVYTGYRTAPIYWHIKHNERGWKGKVHKADAELGFVPVPDSRGAETFPIGGDIPMRYDKYGFRVPLEDGITSPNRHPVVLALGSSFTYGAAVPAENTYSYLVGQGLRGSTRNAGVGGYGLAQMLVLARRLVPTYKPDYLLVQYSPWLAGWAQSPFAASYLGKVPIPYFFVSQNELAVQPPVFQTKIMDLPTDKYRNTQVSVIDKVSFLWHVGLPLYVHDDFNMCSLSIRRLLGLVPQPAPNAQEITKYVYGELAKVAKENGAKLVIVVLGADEHPVQAPDTLFPPDSIAVNAQSALLRNLPVVNSREEYQKAYMHWRGSPLTIVDAHPNETAHRIIAEAIIQKIQETTETQAASPKKRISLADIDPFFSEQSLTHRVTIDNHFREVCNGGCK